MSFELKINDLYWIKGVADDPADLCLHGKVFVKIGDKVIDDGIEKDWAVSAGAYYMLKSVYSDHLTGSSEVLHPCCGHFMFIDEKTDALVIMDCPLGLDWSVKHEGCIVKLIVDEHTQIVIPLAEYKETVFEFADAIKSFYNACSPKVPTGEKFEVDGYQKFWEDWEKLRNGNIVV